MRDNLNKIVSITMAVLLLASTVSWTVDKHLCMGRVMDVAFFHNAEDCGMKAALAVLESDQKIPHCCDDESLTIAGQDDLMNVIWDDIDIANQYFIQSFVYTYHNLLVDFFTNEQPIFESPPPRAFTSLHILYEVYLI